ncbi:MAG: hypothetical protein AAGD01_13130 [Acidobacteriota bacterium]
MINEVNGARRSRGQSAFAGRQPRRQGLAARWAGLLGAALLLWGVPGVCDAQSRQDPRTESSAAAEAQEAKPSARPLIQGFKPFQPKAPKRYQAESPAPVQERPPDPGAAAGSGAAAQGAEPTPDDLVLARHYRGVLRRYADGDHRGALRELQRFEKRFVGERLDASGQGDLWRIQAMVVRDLMQREPEILLPVMLLHHDASALYHREQIWHQAGRSRRLAGVLAMEYVRQVKTRGARVTASRVLASLGSYLQEIMSSEVCRCVPFYREALDLDENNLAARYGLATAYEKSGEYLKAARQLEKLLQQKPDFHAARLRLAVNEFRLLNARQGRRMLRELVEEERVDWVSLLAAQELVAGEIDRGRFEDAAKILAVVRQRFPADQSLLIQQVLVQERLRHAGVATEMLGPLRKRSVSVGENLASPNGLRSPRMVYNRTPKKLFIALRQQLQTEAAGRLPLLAKLTPALDDDARAAGAETAGNDVERRGAER